MKRKYWSKVFLIAVIAICALSCELVGGRLCGCAEPPLPGPGKMDAHFEQRPWLSTDVQAFMSAGRITLVAREASTILFSVSGITPGNYEIKKTGKNVVFYTPSGYNVDSASYSTAYGEEELMGGIRIIDVDENRKTISGRFDAYLTSGKGIWMPIQGGFNKIPYEDVLTNTLDGIINNTPFETAISDAGADEEKVYANFFQVNGEAINLSFPRTITVGSYEFSEDYSATYISDKAQRYEAVSGSIAITIHDPVAKRISGTLNFEDGDGNVAVANTTFDLRY